MTAPEPSERDEPEGPWYMRKDWFASYEWAIIAAAMGALFGLAMLITGIAYFANGSDDPQFGLFQTILGVLFLAGNIALIWALRRQNRKSHSKTPKDQRRTG